MEKGLLFQQRKPWTRSYNRVSRKGKQGRTGTQRAISAELILESSLGVCVVRHIGFCLAWWIANWLLCSKARQLKELRWDIYTVWKSHPIFCLLVSSSSETGQTLVTLMVQDMVSLLPWPAAELSTWHKQKKHPVHLKWFNIYCFPLCYCGGLSYSDPSWIVTIYLKCRLCKNQEKKTPFMIKKYFVQ